MACRAAWISLAVPATRTQIDSEIEKPGDSASSTVAATGLYRTPSYAPLVSVMVVVPSVNRTFMRHLHRQDL